MRRKINVIQINGFRGILMAVGIVSCLIAGFVVFPGIVMRTGWNILSSYTGMLPRIATLQGVLLWGITVVAYLAFRKNPFLVQFKSSEDLSREEMDAVMQKIRVEHQADILTRAMLKAKELETSGNSEVEKKETENNENSQNIS